MIYNFKGGYYYPALAAKFAIWPIKVLSPVDITTPFPVPYLFKVEKKAMFFVYNGLSLVHWVVLTKS